jgi:OmcA/MtrC family decaheme c-type cytochrome
MQNRYFHYVLFTFIGCWAVALTGCGGGGGGGAAAPGGFTGNALFDNLNFDLDITSVNIGPDLRPEITFTARDDAGLLIPLSEFTDARFILAVLERTSVGAAFQYRSYTTVVEMAMSGAEASQDTYDTARQDDMTVNADGSFTYKFENAIPAGYDRTATHQLGGQFRYARVTRGAEPVTYRANIAFTFRPDGMPVSETREIVSTESCNTCHTRLSEHGDIRREVQLCILCHNTHSTDAETGNSLQFANMIHKIHRGANLPSFTIDGEKYEISGFEDRVHDYSTVHYPQDIRNCTSCHSNASQAHIHETAPSLEGCTACHDRTWFGPIDETPTSFTNHIGGAHADNSLCATCHSPQGNQVALVSAAHILPTESITAPGLNLDVIDVETFVGLLETGVTITFSAEDGNNAPITDLSDLDIVAATVAYPVPEYETFMRENISSAFAGPDGVLVNNGDGTYDYTFDTEVPIGSTDTFSVAMEGRREFMFRGDTYEQGTAGNGQMLFTLDASTPVNRRMVVSEEKCNVCHGETRFHGELRPGVNFCVMCHNPNTTDEGQRPGGQLPPVTVSFKDMIHQIHTGEDLEQEYTVYGFGSRPHDYTEVRFPGLRQECSICHEEDTTSVPLPSEAISTIVTQDAGMTFISEMLPTRAACITCHDSDAANTHALLQTNAGVESCAVCHSDSDDLSVALTHALRP